MKTVLHILTQPGDELARDVIAAHARNQELVVLTADLTTALPDYDTTLDALFSADTVCVW